jgi:hypothetical protein
MCLGVPKRTGFRLSVDTALFKSFSHQERSIQKQRR